MHNMSFFSTDYNNIVLTISFEESSYEVVEGERTLEVCVVQSIVSLEEDIIIVLANVPSTASSGSTSTEQFQ